MSLVLKKKAESKGKNPALEPPFPLCKSSPNFTEAFASIANLLASRKKILVLSGAGTSVSCGIPDFRSKEGLYQNLDFEGLGLTCAEELFDLQFFQHDPSPFYAFAKTLYFPLGNDQRVEPSDSHRFLALLEQRKQLLRVYTQNIDGLEEAAGVSPKRMVYAHGSLQWATCCKCKRKVPACDIESAIKKGSVPRCQAPTTKNGLNKNGGAKLKPPVPSSTYSTRQSASPMPKRRRLRSDESADFCNDNVCGGVLKPNITFFGETLHDKVRKSLESDRDNADLILVIGTSLSVAPMSKVINYLPPSIPRILINRTIVHPLHNTVTEKDGDQHDSAHDEEKEFRENHVFDGYMLGFCDDVTRALVKKMKGAAIDSDLAKGQLLATLTEDNEQDFTPDDWKSTTLPTDRVFLFPGATCGGFDANEATYREIAHCDGCAEEIATGLIRKCSECFDYDLCAQCFPKLSKSHFGGKHRFTKEPATDPNETH